MVDGTDVHAVYRVVREARRRALAGEGPTLVEAQVYRLGPHSTSDDPRRYRSDAELAQWKERDPIARLKHELLRLGALTEETDQQVWEAAKQLVSSALKDAEATAPVDPRTMFEDVFARLPPHLEEERRAFEQLMTEGVLRP